MPFKDELEQEGLLAKSDSFDNMNFEEVTIVDNNNDNPGASVNSTQIENNQPINQPILNKSAFSEYSAKVNWNVFFAISLFTLGAWLDISAIWSELVYLVDELPEGWSLPSILNVISVIAQLGPLSFSVGRYFWPKKFTFVRAIYFIFTIGLFSCLFLSLFWNKTEVVLGTRRSIYLYVFNFTLSLLDGISTVAFLPYIGSYFSKEYIIPNYIGESMSSLVPGLFAVFQSIGVKDECEYSTFANGTFANLSTTILIDAASTEPLQKGSLLKSHKLTPNYSVTLYFIIMFVLLFGSASAFTFLHFSKTARRVRKPIGQANNNEENINMSRLELVQEDTLEYKPNHANVKRKKALLLLLTFMGSFIQYGYLPGLLSYSTIPYGNVYFHLSINLSSICLPLAIFLSIWSYQVSTKQILFEFSLAASFASYIVIVSYQSPCPFFVSAWFGGHLIVLCWVLCSCMFLRLRCLIATKLEAYGPNTLFIFGMATIAGQVLGGTLIFISVDIYHTFKEKAKCSTVQTLC